MTVSEQLTFSIHIRIQIQLGNVGGRSGLDPHALPNTTARRVEDVRGAEGLLANRDHIRIAVGRVMSKDEPR